MAQEQFRWTLLPLVDPSEQTRFFPPQLSFMHGTRTTKTSSPNGSMRLPSFIPSVSAIECCLSHCISPLEISPWTAWPDDSG